MTALDWLMARRACALSVGFAAVLALVVISTDEQSTTVGARFARFASLLAVAGSAGALRTTEQARSRGELRALEALGVAPSRASFGAALGGMVVGVAGAALMLSRSVDLSPLLPRLQGAGVMFRPAGPGVAMERTLGVWLQSSGVLLRAAAESPHVGPDRLAVSGWLRPSVAAALLVLAISAPYWASLSVGFARRVCVGGAAVVSCVLAFHLVGAGGAPAWVLPLAPLVLVVDCTLLGFRERS